MALSKQLTPGWTVLPLAIFLEIICPICMKYPWNHCACNTPFDYGLFFLPGSGDKIGESCYSCPGSGVPRKGGPTVATLYLSPLHCTILYSHWISLPSTPSVQKRKLISPLKFILVYPDWSPLNHFFFKSMQWGEETNIIRWCYIYLKFTFTLIVTSKGSTDKKPWAQYRSSNKYFNISNSDIVL